MQKQGGIKPARAARKKAFEVTPSRMSENAFLECITNITFIQSYTKSYILYRDYIFLSLLENIKAINTSKKKGTMHLGANTAFLLQLRGQAKELGGQLPPSLYVKKGPALRSIRNKTFLKMADQAIEISRPLCTTRRGAIDCRSLDKIQSIIEYRSDDVIKIYF